MPDHKDLTTRQGHPVYDNQNQRTIGNRGPSTLENYHFLEKISHFDRERIPERVVHARGCVVHGFFEAYGTIGDQPSAAYTRAKLFAGKGKRTPVTVRFSTVIGGRDSSEAARDPRGFAVKFRTEDGNWDLVGNTLPVFFIRDAIKSRTSSTHLSPIRSHFGRNRIASSTSWRIRRSRCTCFRTYLALGVSPSTTDTNRGSV